MAKAAIELYPPGFDSIKNFIFPNEDGALLECCSGVLRIRWADDTDSQIGLDGMGKTQSISNYRAIFGSTKLKVDLVLGGSRGTAHFEGSDIAVQVPQSVDSKS